LTRHPAPAPALGAIEVGCHAFDVTFLRERDQHGFVRHQVLFFEFLVGFANNPGAAIIAEFFGERSQVLFDQAEDFNRVSEQLFEVSDPRHYIAVFILDLLSFQCG